MDWIVRTAVRTPVWTIGSTAWPLVVIVACSGKGLFNVWNFGIHGLRLGFEGRVPSRLQNGFWKPLEVHWSPGGKAVQRAGKAFFHTL